jgi:hypothetical protein
VPHQIEAIADRCLARSRAHRYQSADEVATALREFLREYMADYSRSHLGRYVRKMFATEIEKELRMLEEYVVSEVVDADVGENLIGDVLGPHAEFTKFSPNPSGAGAGDQDTGYDTLAEGSSQVRTNHHLEFSDEDSRTVVDQDGPPRPSAPPRRLVGAGAPTGAAAAAVAASSLSIHEVDTDILEHRRHRRRKK